MKRDHPTHTYRITPPHTVIKEIDKYLARYPQFVNTGLSVLDRDGDTTIYQVRYVRFTYPESGASSSVNHTMKFGQ